MPEVVLPYNLTNLCDFLHSEGSLPESPVLNSRAEYSGEYAAMSMYLAIFPSTFISLFEITSNGGQAYKEHLQGLRQLVELRCLLDRDLMSGVGYLVEQLHSRVFCG